MRDIHGDAASLLDENIDQKAFRNVVFETRRLEGLANVYTDTVESLVCPPPSMTHAPVSPEALAAAGISQSLIRLSVGLEASEDLVDDVLRALAAARSARISEPVAVFG